MTRFDRLLAACLAGTAIAAFAWIKKKGYCEYFATAGVVLLRRKDFPHGTFRA